MNKNIIKLTESQLHNIIKESVNKVLSEADWKTFLNAARGRKKQADKLREHPFLHGRNSYDDAADKLEKHAQETFQKNTERTDILISMKVTQATIKEDTTTGTQTNTS